MGYMKNIIKNTNIAVSFLSLTACYPLVSDMAIPRASLAAKPLYEELLINSPQLKPTDRAHNPDTGYLPVYYYYNTLPRNKDAMFFMYYKSEYCDVNNKKYCITFAIDEPFLENEKTQDLILNKLKYPCKLAITNLKEDFSDQVFTNESYASKSLSKTFRLTGNKDLQEYFGCNSLKNVERDIALIVVKNLGDVGGFFGSWTKSRIQTYEESIIKKYVIKTTNQIEVK